MADQAKLLKKLPALYQKMADLTLPECRSNCNVPLSCCSKEYCSMTIDYAMERFGVKLNPTDHLSLPLMGESGCIAAPHLRPLCTMHTCKINSFGFKPNDEDWTRKYFKLRSKIENLEFEISSMEKKA